MYEFYTDFQLPLFNRLSKCPTLNMATFRTSLKHVEIPQVSFAYFYLQLRSHILTHHGPQGVSLNLNFTEYTSHKLAKQKSTERQLVEVKTATTSHT
jgi:hypothetical protein